MNYKRIYDQLVTTDYTNEEYTELHHIVPRCMDGSDDKSNLVPLSYKAHQLAHHLLHKIYPNHSGLEIAYRLMSNKPANGEITKTQWTDPVIREKMCKGISKAMSGKKQSPEVIANRVAKNTGQKRTPEQAKRIAKGVEASGVYDRRRKSYLIIHPDGTEEVILGLRKWCRQMGFYEARFCEILRGVRDSWNGYTCQRLTTSD